MDNLKPHDSIGELASYMAAHGSAMRQDDYAMAVVDGLLAYLADGRRDAVCDGRGRLCRDVAGLSQRMCRNADKLDDINGACEKAFEKWRDDAVQREISRQRLLNDVHTKFKACLHKIHVNSSSIVLLSFDRSAEDYRV